MALFEMEFKIPEETKKQPNIKLKKGQTIDDLIAMARTIVMEKLGKYKDTSRCVTQIDDLYQFIQNTPDDSILAIDCETTGLNTFSDELVGISVCNGKECLYVPINHKSSLYGTRLPLQVNPEDLKEWFKHTTQDRSFKWVYHNAKFDLSVFETFLGFYMPAPYWDTMLASNLMFQDEEHSLKYQYNKYVAEEDEGVNRFDTLFKGVTFDYIPLDISTIYAG